jgi:hypothetical protein
VTWDDFRETILEPIYQAEHTANDQQIGILFISLAISILVEPKQQTDHLEAQRYYRLSRASMSLGEVDYNVSPESLVLI